MHRISQIIIKNFRACKEVHLPLGSFTPLVGPNNTGKSTILEAIRWALKSSALSESDFHKSGEAVVVAACVEGITADLLEKIPEEKHRKAIEPYCKDGKLWIRRVATGTSAKAMSSEIWDIDKCADHEQPDVWRDYPTGLPQAVSVLLPEPVFIEAMEDIGEDLGKAKAGSTIKQLLDEIMAPIVAAHEDLNKALDTIRHILTADGNKRSTHLKDFDQQATDALTHFFPGLALDLDLQVVDVKEFFKAGDLHVTDKATGDRRRFDQMGTGAQRSIQMALIRYLSETRNAKNTGPSRRLLLIDEPELYLHPQGVRRLRQALGTLSNAGFQVVFSTHSPLMLSRENAADTVIVNKFPDDGVKTQLPLRHAVSTAFADAESQSRTLFELGNLAEIYFSDRVVLCEGKTDRRLLPLAYQQLYGHPPELDHIAFVSLGSCADLRKAMPVLASMGIEYRVVADLDFAFTHARTGGTPLLAKDGADLQEAKALLAILQAEHGYTLGGNGLPENARKTGWSAADAWAVMARHDKGKAIVQKTNEDLRRQGVFVWSCGCIEDVTGHTDKGEEAIAAQEEKLRKMMASDIAKGMPLLKECCEWLRA
ncbi:MAG: ATP-dependent endonuclease [Dechloromonas sp.]|nr:ATP-dependent endonuclease [Dechloromonas sp.]